MNKIRRVDAINNLVAVCLLVVSLWGCASRPLAPGGVYNGNQVLYEADNAITTGHAVLQDFVTWEANNREVLSKYPEIKKLADAVYTDGPKWFASAAVVRDAYAANPTAENADKLKSSIDILKAAIHEASNYLTSNKAPPASKSISTTTK